MALKDRLKDFIPPFIIKSIRQLRNEKALPEKIYASYADALKDCESTNSYENEDIVGMVYEKTKRLIPQLENGTYLTLDFVNACNLMSLSAFITNKELIVIDVGGACGAHYFYFKKILGNKIPIIWHVVETEAMCKKARAFENTELKFFSDLQAASQGLNKIDLLLSSSTLQYVKDPRAFLINMIKLNASYVLLPRLSLTQEDKDIITVQKSMLSNNGPGALPTGISDREVKYPHTNMKEQDLFDILDKDYTLKIKFADNSGMHTVSGYKIVGYGLFYEKK